MANYNVDIKLQVQGLQKVQDLNKTVEKLNQETKNLQGRLNSGNPFNAAGAVKLNRALQEGINKTQTLARRNKEAADQAKREAKNVQNLINLRKELQRVELDRVQRRGQQRKAGFQSAALGVGFPLLFGGGAGSIAGGLLGSAGGFGGQILGSAIGQQIDQFAQKTAELGVALSKTGLDVGTVTKAAGELGSEAERLISELQEVAGSEEAAAVAADLLANKIGKDGVRALEEFGTAGQELGAAVSELNTEFMVLAATLLGPVVKGIAGVIQRANLASQTSTMLRAGGPEAGRLRAAGQRVVDAGGSADDKNIAMQNEAAKILEERRQKALQAARDASAQNSISLQILEAEGDLLKGKSDLMDRANFLKAIEIEGLKLEKALRKENITDLEKKLALQQHNNNIQTLQNQRSDAFASQAEKERREAEKAAKKLEEAKKKENEILRRINELIISNNEISLKSVEIAHGEQEALAHQAAVLFEKFRLLKKNVKLSTEDARVKDLQLKKLDLQKQLESNQISSRQRSLMVEKAITAEKQKQTLAAIGTDIGRQMQDANFRSTGNRDQDAQIALRISQIRRQEDAITRLTNAIREQQITINNPPNADAAMRAEKERKNLQDQLDLYNQLLPQLDAAEQAQLRFNQALEAAQPLADAITSGLLDGMVALADGTKTAEQAFADFLNSIAKMLMQTAQQMIAQYMALGIARIFAGVPAASSGVNTSFMGSSFNPLSFVAGPFSGYGTRALGGSVSGNRPYLVGERGPELFVPGAQGNIVPSNAMGGVNVGTINISVENTGEQLSPQAQKQLAGQVKGIVLGTLANERRSGGML